MLLVVGYDLVLNREVRLQLLVNEFLLEFAAHVLQRDVGGESRLEVHLEERLADFQTRKVEGLDLAIVGKALHERDEATFIGKVFVARNV